MNLGHAYAYIQYDYYSIQTFLESKSQEALKKARNSYFLVLKGRISTQFTVTT